MHRGGRGACFLAAGTALAWSLYGGAAQSAELQIEEGAVILFQGDSITDGFRFVKDRFCDYGLGVGYVKMIADLLPALYPARKATVINRGVSGNKVKDLVKRWEQDCLALNPTWVSIMIGVNDCSSFHSDDPAKKAAATSPEEYETVCRGLLKLTKERLPRVRLVLMEPYLLPYRPDYAQLRPDLDLRIAIVRKLAREFGAILVPTDRIMNAAEESRGERSFWTLGDGCHPQSPGSALMATAWLRAVGALPPEAAR